MSLVLERLGNGAALLLRDEVSGVALLLSCGEARDSLGAGVAPDGGDGSARQVPGDGSDDSADGSDDPALAGLASPFVRRYARELKDTLARGGGASLAAVLVPDYRPQACGMLPFLTERAGAAALPPVLMTHATRAIAPHVLAEYWYAPAPSSMRGVDPHAYCVGVEGRRQQGGRSPTRARRSRRTTFPRALRGRASSPYVPA
jgi:hypothetical protein